MCPAFFNMAMFADVFVEVVKTPLILNPRHCLVYAFIQGPVCIAAVWIGYAPERPGVDTGRKIGAAASQVAAVCFDGRRAVVRAGRGLLIPYLLLQQAHGLPAKFAISSSSAERRVGKVIVSKGR